MNSNQQNNFMKNQFLHISKQHVNNSHDVVQQFSQLSIKESSPIGSDWRPSTTFVGVDAILIDVG
ncbi:hypothetical protein BLOT_008342 [Blomia tropicalis]|nr:hypothetical protein BLOT_008342 [Blomia tropicalis]